ncbi:MAG: hypothetical protein Q4P34_01470 [Tissierellia bacterium]|nr:hypothetical protein [Tissierellia bacterium]
MINKKDDSITVLEFQKIKYFPKLAIISLLIGFVLGIVAYYFTKKVSFIFAFTLIGVAVYIFLAWRYRCPDCNCFLWFLKDKSRIKRCPKCQALLRGKR